MIPFLVIFEIICHIMSFTLMRIDKKNAVLRHGRIPKAGLLFFALLGPLGTLAGMIWPFGYGHHKTRKPSFWITAFLGVVLHILAIVYVLKYHI